MSHLICFKGEKAVSVFVNMVLNIRFCRNSIGIVLFNDTQKTFSKAHAALFKLLK
jgi:hypothetical protein